MLAVATHTDASAFLSAAEACLCEHEAVNNVPLGIADAIRRGKRHGGEKARFWTVQDGVAVVGAALCTPPHFLLLSRMPDAAARALGRALARAGVRVPGVMVEQAYADVFTDALLGPAAACRVAVRTRMFELHAVSEVPEAVGGPRLAVADDEALLWRWLQAFCAEAAPHNPPPQVSNLRFHLEKQAYLLWTDTVGEPVSVALRNRELPHGASIGPVYTPPEQRGRGYATSLVAELSRRVLAGGKRFTCLATDLANPTSNRIYPKIGYRPVADFVELSIG